MTRSLMDVDRHLHWTQDDLSEGVVYLTDHTNFYARGSYHSTPDCHILRRKPKRRDSGNTWQFPIVTYPKKALPDTVTPCGVCCR